MSYISAGRILSNEKDNGYIVGALIFLISIML